jgi:hypothetical protein
MRGFAYSLFPFVDVPDVTIITPVFDASKKNVIFFTASRCHHADVGGILPGSMPPTSTTIFQEGAQVTSFEIVRAGSYDHEGLVKRFVDESASYPGSSETRCMKDVESDHQAQIAANNRGVQLLAALIEEYGLETVQHYVLHIRNTAESVVRSLLRIAAERFGKSTLHAIDYMDDGSPIELTITIDRETGSAVFAFEGTGTESWSSLNAPVSVCSSAVSLSSILVLPLLRLSVELTLPSSYSLLHAHPRRRGDPPQRRLSRPNRVQDPAWLHPQPLRDLRCRRRKRYDESYVSTSSSRLLPLVQLGDFLSSTRTDDAPSFSQNESPTSSFAASKPSPPLKAAAKT